MRSVQEVLVFVYTEERCKLWLWVNIIFKSSFSTEIQGDTNRINDKILGSYWVFFFKHSYVLFCFLLKKTHEVSYQAEWIDGHIELKGYPSKKSLYFHGNLGYKQHDL